MIMSRKGLAESDHLYCDMHRKYNYGGRSRVPFVDGLIHVRYMYSKFSTLRTFLSSFSPDSDHMCCDVHCEHGF